MRQFFKWFLSVVLVVTGLVSNAQTGSISSKKTLRVLLIGNSFSQNASTFLPQIAKDDGNNIVFGHAELPGCPLQRHWQLAELNSAEPENPKGKPYEGDKSLRMLLSDSEWDVITMQQYSMLSGNLNTYKPYAQQLYALIRQYQPKARILLHQTWAYRSDSKSFGEVDNGKLAQTEKEMYEKSRAAYHLMARELNLNIIPTGDAFWLIGSNPKTSFKKDESFDPLKAVYPALPHEQNSLHAGYSWSNGKLNFDSHHANDAGKYLGGLVWYAVLFNKPVTQMKFKPQSVSDEFAAQLKAAATAAVKGGKQ
ncbi:DUF4886 domain-containing protein [Mucilaginibacter terrae]|uniref:DUF4886 domain-containing protein n=1 Tax=Mucilaginibacter terrae TaxID=1955052 RepID=A0ABU3GQZ3_9SPHI|nr:DUF4886 domain-containing protein [Mucilaginibacter terrae]MDT3402055.1 hypothetical protein [Mucilaginibacter terrae]